MLESIQFPKLPLKENGYGHMILPVGMHACVSLYSIQYALWW